MSSFDRYWVTSGKDRNLKFTGKKESGAKDYMYGTSDKAGSKKHLQLWDMRSSDPDDSNAPKLIDEIKPIQPQQ